MTEKTLIDGIDGIRSLNGTVIGPSKAVLLTQEMIEKFCEAVDNDEWIHLDVERSAASPLGSTIAPGMLTQSFFSTLWFDMVDIRNMNSMLFIGSDKVRLVQPLKCGDSFTMTAKIDSVEDKGAGVQVKLGVTWDSVNTGKPVTVGTFVLRYS